MRFPYLLIASSLVIAAGSARAVVYSAGHGDLRITYSGGVFSTGYHFDPGTIVDGAPVTNPLGADHAPTAVVTWIQNPSIASPPPAGQWSFLGSSAGQPIWVIPQTQTQDITKPWLGTNTESLSPADWTGPLTITLESVTAPAGGYFSLFNSDAFGSPVVAFDTFDGIGADDLLDHALGTHVHYNWFFTQPGVYEMTWKVSGTHVTDGLRETTSTLTFGVVTVPEPTGALLGGLTLLGALLRRRRQS